MTPMETERGGCGGGGGSIDPSNLHLKKELTQIRKAARLLRDPGTSSLGRSPLNSARSLTKRHYVHHHKNSTAVASSSDQFLQVQSNANNYINGNGASDKGNVNVKGKERRVFLYNWRSQKSENEISRQIGEDDVENSEGFWAQDGECVAVDSSSDARNGGGNDSKTDAYLSERCSSAIFRCKDTNFSPSVRRAIKQKPKRSNYSSAGLRHHNGKLQKQIASSKCGEHAVEGLPGLGLGREDLVSLIDQSDAEEYCNCEDLRMASARSPLLARLKSTGWVHSPTKLLRSHRKEDDSVSHSTPALSTSSCNKYSVRNPSPAESWDATTGSLNGADDEVHDQLHCPRRQGCGIPCYWSKRSTPKSRIGCGSGCSPSISDTLRRKGSRIFCGSQSIHQRRPHRSSLGSNKRRLNSRSPCQSHLPLLTDSGNNRGESSVGSGESDDEISTNFGKLDLEALSGLDGRRWSSSCRSRDGLELVAINGEVREESSPENDRNLSHKYRPMFFEELSGQNIVVQSLVSAISRGRVSSIYLFQGPRGTGKTSMARIFAAALNCLTTEDTKPCGECRECADYVSGKSTCLSEVDGSSKKGIEDIKNILKNLSVVHPPALSRFKVFVVDECHLLPSKTWLTFLRLLEKPLPHVVFILVTTDAENVPRTVLSWCQKHVFNKISNGDIVTRLSKIATSENLAVESDALGLIASNADGSLRDAETKLHQLSLFGKRITISLVNELIGVVSDEKLLDLLELAMSSNATETVIRARELMDSGVDPIVLMSQMATLIVDIIAGTYPSLDGKHDSFFRGRSLSERELDRLKHALTLLSEAEKHLRVTSERSTWFTATLLQLGSMPSPDGTQSGSSRRQSSKATEEDLIIRLREAAGLKQRIDAQLAHEKSGSPKSFPISAHCNSTSKDTPISRADLPSSKPNAYRAQGQFTDGKALPVAQDDCKGGRTTLRCVNSRVLNNIWLQCIEKCHSMTLRQLLHSHGRLVSVSEVKGGFVAHIAFGDKNIKARAEGFISSITNSFEIVLQHNVEVKIILLPDSLGQRQTDKNTAINLENKSTCSDMAVGNADIDLHQKPVKVLKGSFNVCGGHQAGEFELVEGNVNASSSKGRKLDIPVKRIESIIHEQKLESAWLQEMEKGTPGALSCLKPERNQVLPQDSTYPPHELVSMQSTDMHSQHWEDELNREIRALKLDDRMTPQKDQTAKSMSHYPVSPSWLHDRSSASNPSKDNMGYESGSGAPSCGGVFCWNNARPHRREGKNQAKQGTPLRLRKDGRFLCFGECAKSRKTDKNRQ